LCDALCGIQQCLISVSPESVVNWTAALIREGCKPLKSC
jgi:hypothetical protein